MHALVVEFALPESTDVDAVRPMLRRLESASEGLPGLRFRAFVLDRERRVYRAFIVLDTHTHLNAFLESDPYQDIVRQLGTPRMRIDGVPTAGT